MTAKTFNGQSSVFGFAIVFFMALGVSSAQNTHLGTETEMDRAMQQNAVRKEQILTPNVKVNKAEESAYKALLAAQDGDPATIIQQGEDFITKFPTSHYLPGVYGVLTSSYFAAGDTDKMFAAGGKAIQLDPQNVDAMSLLAMAIPRRVKPSTPVGEQELQIAEQYARRAMEIIPVLKKPATMDDATFEKAKNDKLALVHSGLGLINTDRQKYDEARTELTQAVQLASSPDPVDYFMLGNADVQTSYFQDAVAAYEKCAASGPLMVRCKARIESTKHAAGSKVGR